MSDENPRQSPSSPIRIGPPGEEVPPPAESSGVAVVPEGEPDPLADLATEIDLGPAMLLNKICPYEDLGFFDPYFCYWACEFDDDCGPIGDPFVLYSEVELTVGCPGPDCTPSLLSGDTHAIEESRFSKTSPTGRAAFRIRGGADPRDIGLSQAGRRSPDVVPADREDELRVIEWADVQIDALDHRVRLFLVRSAPQPRDGRPFTPALVAFGYELDVPKDGTEPRLTEVEQVGERYYQLYRPGDDIVFHVLAS